MIKEGERLRLRIFPLVAHLCEVDVHDVVFIVPDVNLRLFIGIILDLDGELTDRRAFVLEIKAWGIMDLDLIDLAILEAPGDRDRKHIPRGQRQKVLFEFAEPVLDGDRLDIVIGIDDVIEIEGRRGKRFGLLVIQNADRLILRHIEDRRGALALGPFFDRVDRTGQNRLVIADMDVDRRIAALNRVGDQLFLGFFLVFAGLLAASAKRPCQNEGSKQSPCLLEGFHRVVAKIILEIL